MSDAEDDAIQVQLAALPTGWRYASVRDVGASDEQAVLTGPFGTRLGRADFIDEGVPLLTISCLTNQGIRLDKALFVSKEKAKDLQRYRLRVGGVLFSRTASVGRSGIVGLDLEGALFNYHIMRLRSNQSKLLPKFFTNYVRGAKQVKDYLLTVNHGATRDGINTEQLLALPVIVASIAEQQRVVAEIEKQFTRLNAGVAAPQRVQANLKRYRAAVLKAACEGRLVLTEAELARAEGRTFETGEQLLARVLVDRRKNWQGRGKYRELAAPDTTNLPSLSEGWAWTNIGQLAEVGTGSTPARGNPEFYAGGTIPWVTSGAVNNPCVERTDQFVTTTALEKCNLTLYPSGTLLLAMYGEGKTRGMASELMFSATTNQALAAIEVPEVLRSFVKVVLWKNYDDVRKVASGGVQPNLNLSLVRAIRVALPPLTEQARIVAEVERHLSVIEELEATVAANLQRATRLRQSVLQKAFAVTT